jgi:hypothetical protein
MQIVEILEVGPGWNKVRLADGNVYTLDGAYSWRSNNPGNIEYGDFARSLGAIGEGAVPAGRKRGFAIFPTLEDGQRAREVLQFESPSYLNADNADRWGHAYPAGSIGAAIYRYAPPTENDTEGYIRQVSNAAGVPPETLMKDLTSEQRAAFMAAQQHHEGWKSGDVINEAGIKLPPNEIPQTVGTELSVNPDSIGARVTAMLDAMPPVPRPRSEATVARVNDMLNQPRPAEMSPEMRAARSTRSDAPVPAPRSQGTAARVNAMLDQPRPVTMSPEMRAEREARATPVDVPMPRPRPETGSGATTPAPQEAPGLGGGASNPRLLPIIGPTGNTKVDPVGEMPRYADVAGLGRPAAAPADARAPQGPPMPAANAPPAPRSVTRTEGVAGTVQMQPGARPEVADSLIRQAQQARPVPSGGLVGQEAAPAAAPAAVAEPTVPKYIVTEKKVPLGDVVRHTSRDSVAAAAAGRRLAESEELRTIRTTALNPVWVDQKRQLENAATPGVGAAGAPAGAPGLGAGPPALTYGAPPKPPKRPDSAPPSTKAGQAPTLLGGLRRAVGLPEDGLGPMIQDGVRNVFGLGQDGQRRRPLFRPPGPQNVTGSLSGRPPVNPSLYHTNPVAFGNAAVALSGDDSTGNQAEAAAARASGEAWRGSR